MKKSYLILAAIAITGMVSCSSEDFVGESTGQPTGEQTISFGSQFKAVTRGDLYGSAAAEKLGNKFVVFGTKHVDTEDETADNDKVVFNNFQVAYSASTAGKTASNSSDWDYVGLQAYDATPTKQGIKYWDFSATKGYTFYAFSYHDDDDASAFTYPKATTNKVTVTKVTEDASSLYNKGYQVTVKDGAVLNNLYFSDRVPVAKEDYEKIVNFTFRNIGAKVRFGFYETIPGYKVTIDKFYIDADANDDSSAGPVTAPVTSFAAMNVGKADGFYATLQNVKRGVDQTLNVTYYDDTDATTENRPQLTNPTEGYEYSFKLGTASSIINKDLATTSSAPTWVDGSSTGDYTPVFPFEANNNPLLLKLDFTMTADDGSNDVIHVRGARAVVPAEYVKWKSNFAYTYIFKISDKTNGTTGKVDANGDPIEDPEGLKPITFDAIVVNMADERQETITSVSSNSITTYAEGAIANEYTTGKAIYVVASNSSTGAVITPTGLGGNDGEAQVYKLNKAATESEVIAQKTGSPMGIEFTAQSTTIADNVPLADGTKPAIKNVKFTPATAGTYAYIYTTTAYEAPTFEVQTSGTYDSSETYYMLSGSGAYFAVPVSSKAVFDANKANLYLQTDGGTPGVYTVKVIKVQ